MKAPTNRKKLKNLELVKNWKLYILALPALLIFFIFAYLPLPGIVLAFERYTLEGGIFGSEWVGFDNFELFFLTADVGKLLGNVLSINLSGLIVNTVVTVFTAICLNQLFSTKAQKAYQNILFLPYFFSAIMMVRLAMLFFDDTKGVINLLLQQSGLQSIEFSKVGGVWVPIVVVTSLIKGLGYGIIVYLATITGMDESIYEAARIDGAGRMVQIFRITLPLLRPTIILLTLMSVGRMFFGDFVYLSAFSGTNEVIRDRLDVFETFIFRNLTSGNLYASPDYGLNAAVGLFQSLLGFVMIFGCNLIVRKIDKDSALF